MPISGNLESRLPTALAAIDTYKKAAVDTTGSEKFASTIGQAEIVQLMQESEAFKNLVLGKIALRTADLTRLSQQKDRQIRPLYDKFRAGTALTPSERDIIRTFLEEVKQVLEELYTEVAERILVVEEKEVGLNNRLLDLQRQKQDAVNRQGFGADVTAELQNIDAEVNRTTAELDLLSDEKAVLQEFFTAFSGGDMGDALITAQSIRTDRDREESERLRKEAEAAAKKEKEEEENPERLRQIPRNDFERYLLTARNIPPEEIALPDPSLDSGDYEKELIARYERIKQHLMHIMIEQIESNVIPNTLRIPDIHISNIKISFRDQTGATVNSTLAQVIESAPSGVPGHGKYKEEKIAGEFVGAMYNEIAGPLQDIIAFNQKFNPSKEGGESTGFPGYDELDSLYGVGSNVLNAQFWENITNLPPVRKREGQGFETAPMSVGEKIFWSLREALLRNRYQRSRMPDKVNGVLTDSSANYTRLWSSYVIPDAIAKDSRKRNKGALRFKPRKVNIVQALRHDEAEDWEGKELRMRITASGEFGNLFPLSAEKRPGSSDIQMDRYNQVKNGLASGGGTSGLDTEGANFATAWGLALADITLEGAMGDSQYQKEKSDTDKTPVSYTLGGRVVDRVMNPLGYGYKGFAENNSGELNTFNKGQLGLIYQYAFSFFDYFGYGGKTLAQHIIDCETFEEFKHIKWEVLSGQATKAWTDHVSMGVRIARTFENGFKNGDLQKLSTFDLAKGELTVNEGLMQELGDLVDKFCRYHIEADCAPENVNAVLAKGMKDDSFELDDTAENPTGQFVIYRIVTEDQYPQRNEYARQIRETKNVGDRKKLKKRLGAFYKHESYRADELLQIETLDIARWFDAKGWTLSTTHKSQVEVDPVTGQSYYTIVVRPEGNGEPAPLPNPGELINWQVFYATIFASSFRGEDIVDLDIEDLVLLGMMMSEEFKDWIENNRLKGILSQKLTEIGRRISPEYAKVIIPNLFSFKQRMSAKKFFEFLILIGVKQKNMVAELLKETGIAGKQ